MASPLNTYRKTWLLLGVALSLIGLTFLGWRMEAGPDAPGKTAATSLSVVKAAEPSAPQGV